MQRIKAFIRLIFGFSTTEANAFLVLLPLMLIVVVSEPVYQTYFMSNKPDDFADRKLLDSLISTWDKPDETRTATKNKKRDSTKWVTYGTRDSTNSGYKKKKSNRYPTDFKPATKNKQTPTRFDLNTADSTQLKSVYGIGPALSKRIITYRDNIGGFITHMQLYEVWGLDSTVVARLSERTVIAPDFTPTKLAINHCSEQDLARHPYIRTKLARAIVNYRLQHGNFASIDDLKKIAVMDEKIFLRIKPYITLD